jgi:16S rRNA (guanine527-N7)-methyltransferase
MTQEQLLEQRLADGIDRLGVTTTGQQQRLMLELIALLVHWGRAYNLTAVRDPVRMVPYHLLDSLAIARFISGERILDMGTGAGFPGLPLAILKPKRRFVLLDSNGKKVRFVRQAVMDLGLNNVEVVQSRIESYTCREKFATIVTRAFASLNTILRLTRPLLDHPAVLLAPKSRQVNAELEDLPVPSDALRLHRLQVPYLEGARTLVEIQFD